MSARDGVAEPDAVAADEAMAHRGAHDRPWIGVVVVTFAAAEFIHECLESLVASDCDRLKIVVVDNASPDATAAAVRDWASGARPMVFADDWPLERRAPVPKPITLAEFDAETAQTADFDALGTVTLVHSGSNRGFAGGVNVGLRTLRRHPQIGYFWVLNPDSVVEPQTPRAFADAAAAAGRFAVMGGRTLYFGRPDVVQSDGGRLRWPMGLGLGVNRGRPATDCAPPDADALDYISGANMLVSRPFLDEAGLMDESWFLYIEEVDWCLRRGPLPLAVAPEARIRHRAGASSGSSRVDRLESPFSTYMANLNHLRFVARWRPAHLPWAYLAALLVIVKRYVSVGAWPQATAALRGLHGFGPPAAVRRKLDATTWEGIARRTRNWARRR